MCCCVRDEYSASACVRPLAPVWMEDGVQCIMHRAVQCIVVLYRVHGHAAGDTSLLLPGSRKQSG